MKKHVEDDAEACPFPPGVDLPRKGAYTHISNSMFTDPRFVASALLVAGIIFILGLSLAPPPIIQLQSNPPIWNATIPQFVQNPIHSNTGTWIPKYLEVRTQAGDLLLQADQVLVIENCSYSIQGSILVKDQAKLILKNADVYINRKEGSTDTPLVSGFYHMMFLDESGLQVDNSTIYYARPDYHAQIGFYNSSTCRIANSNMSSVDFFGYDKTSFVLEKTGADVFEIGENSSLNLDFCDVNWVIPTMYDYDNDMMVKNDNLRLTATDSSIISLETYYANSTIHVDKPTSGFLDSWNSFRDLAPEGKGFNITLTRTRVSGLLILALDSNLTIRNVDDLDSIHVLRGQTKLVNSSIGNAYLGVSYGGGIVEGCRIGKINLYGGNFELSRSRFEFLVLRPNPKNVSLDQVKVNMIAGHDFNCSLSGDLTVENETAAGVYGDCQVTRGYPVQVLNGDRAAPNVDLKLYNKTGSLLWSGKTDKDGGANFNVTFYGKEYKYALVPSPGLSDTLRLVASGVSGEREVLLRFAGDTPVIVVFPLEQEGALWGQGWFVEAVSVVIAIMVAILYISGKMRKRSGG
jgi:hypothetical protein